MNLKQLRYFVQVVESGSLSKASRQVFVAQPALSTQMTRLEEEVGKPLLVRSVRGVVPTANGLALYHHAKFLLRQFDEAVHIAREEYAEVKGRVTVGLAPETAGILGLEMLEHMRQKYPGIVLNVVAVHSGYLADLSRSGRLDVSILFSKTAASDLTVEPLLDEELYLVLPRESALVALDQASVTLAQVAALPLIFPSPDYGLQRQIMLEFARRNLPYEPLAEIDSLQLCLRYCARGAGATIQPMCATTTLDLPERWRCVPISDVQLSRRNFLYSLPVQKLSMAASLLHAELKDVVRRLVTSGSWRGATLLEIPHEKAEEPAIAGSSPCALDRSCPEGPARID